MASEGRGRRGNQMTREAEDQEEGRPEAAAGDDVSDGDADKDDGLFPVSVLLVVVMLVEAEADVEFAIPDPRPSDVREDEGWCRASGFASSVISSAFSPPATTISLMCSTSCSEREMTGLPLRCGGDEQSSCSTWRTRLLS